MQFRPTLVIVSGLAAACGGSNSNNGDDGVVDAAKVDATIDAPGSTGFFTIPLTTPSGADQGSFYTPSLTTSGKTFLLDLDTGSTTTGIAGTGCTTCAGLSPLYVPAAGATDTGKPDQAQYADGSGWSGEVFTDTAGLGNGSPDVPLGLVEITTQSMFFASNEYQGIFGLGPAALLDPNTDTTAYFDVLTQQKGVTATMAFELCPTNGTMWIGGYDTSHTSAAPQYTPLLAAGVNKDFYSINMTAMAVGATDLGITAATFDNPIVDTGTSLFYIPTTAETALLKNINADPGYKSLFTKGLSQNGTGCVTAKAGTTAATIDKTLPPLTMTLDKVGGGSMTLTVPPMASYLTDGGNGQFCLAIFGGGDQGEATMGDTFMRAFVTVIDIANKQVGFAPTSHCPAPAFPTTAQHGPIVERGRGPHHVRRAH